MKKAALLLFVLLCAAPAFAQQSFQSTNVWFPHLDVGGDPNGLHYVTLVQAANDSSAFLQGTLTVFSDAGTPLSVSFDGGSPATSLQFSLDSGVTRQIQVSLLPRANKQLLARSLFFQGRLRQSQKLQDMGPLSMLRAVLLGPSSR